MEREKKGGAHDRRGSNKKTINVSDEEE